MPERTVICREVTSPCRPVYKHPLIYWLTVPDEYTEDYVKMLVAVERAVELGLDAVDVPMIAQGIDLLFSFPGHVYQADDWRD